MIVYRVPGIVWILWTISGAAGATASPPAALGAKNGAKRKSLLDEALRLHQQGEFDGAAEAYSRLLEASASWFHTGIFTPLLKPLFLFFKTR